MRREVSRTSAAIISMVIAVAVTVSAFVLFYPPNPYPSPQTSFNQTSTATKLAYTDISAPGNPTESITAKVQEIFVIHLAANTGSTGYDWNVTTSPEVFFIYYTTTSVGTLPGATTCSRL